MMRLCDASANQSHSFKIKAESGRRSEERSPRIQNAGLRFAGASGVRIGITRCRFGKLNRSQCGDKYNGFDSDDDQDHAEIRNHADLECVFANLPGNDSFIVGVTRDCRIFAFKSEDFTRWQAQLAKTNSNPDVICPPDHFDVVHTKIKDVDHLAPYNRATGTRGDAVLLEDVINDALEIRYDVTEFKNSFVGHSWPEAENAVRSSDNFITHLHRQPNGEYHLKVGYRKARGEYDWSCIPNAFPNAVETPAMVKTISTMKNQQHNAASGAHRKFALYYCIGVWFFLVAAIVSSIVMAVKVRMYRKAKVELQATLEILQETYCGQKRHKEMKQAFLAEHNYTDCMELVDKVQSDIDDLKAKDEKWQTWKREMEQRIDKQKAKKAAKKKRQQDSSASKTGQLYMSESAKNSKLSEKLLISDRTKGSKSTQPSEKLPVSDHTKGSKSTQPSEKSSKKSKKD